MCAPDLAGSWHGHYMPRIPGEAYTHVFGMRADLTGIRPVADVAMHVDMPGCGGILNREFSTRTLLLPLFDQLDALVMSTSRASFAGPVFFQQPCESDMIHRLSAIGVILRF
jgi:hypothetical protein